jgi:hypothetical protein
MCRRSLVGNSLSQSDGINSGSDARFFPGVLPRVSSCLWVGHQWVVPLCRGAFHRLDRVKGGPWPGRICAFTLDTSESVGMLGVWGRCIPLPLPPRRGVGATADGVAVPLLDLG